MSNEIKQSATELKHLGLLNEIAVRFVVLLLNVYNFATETFKKLISTVSTENAVLSAEGQKLKDLTEEIIVFADIEFDKYAPSYAKELVDDTLSLIYKTKPIIKTLITITQILITPLITTTIFLLQLSKFIIQNITTTTTITTKSAPLVAEAQNPLQKGLTSAQSLLQNGPDLANQVVNTTNSLVNKNPILEAVNSTTQNSLDTTKSLVGGIPLFGNVAQSLVTNPADLANQVVNTTNSLVNENPILEAVNSATQNSLDATTSLAGGIPLVGDVANQIVNTTNSLVNDNPILNAVNSVTQNIGKESQATGLKLALQSAYTTMKLAGIPVIAQVWYEVVNKYPMVDDLSEFILPLVECMCKMYNKVVTFMDEKGYSLFGYLPLVPIDEMKAAYKLVKTSRDGLSAVGDLLGVDNNKGLSAIGDMLGVNKNN